MASLGWAAARPKGNEIGDKSRLKRGMFGKDAPSNHDAARAPHPTQGIHDALLQPTAPILLRGRSACQDAVAVHWSTLRPMGSTESMCAAAPVLERGRAPVRLAPTGSGSGSAGSSGGSGVLSRAGDRVRLLKLDREGSEYAILDGADLSTVEEIRGESHDVVWQGPCGSMDDIVRLLGSEWRMTCGSKTACNKSFHGRG